MPALMGNHPFGPRFGLALVNLAGDAKLEVVASADDQVWAWDSKGKALSGWPRTVKGVTQSPPAVGDVDGDGDPEVVQVGRGYYYSSTSYVHVLHHDGKDAAGWPWSVTGLIFYPATLADLDGDGGQDVIVLHGPSSKVGNVEVLSGDGKPLGSGWKHSLGDFPIGPAATGDVDGNGKLDVAVATSETLYLFQAQGTPLSPFPLKAATGREFKGGVILADLAPSSKGLEIITCDEEAGVSGLELRLLAYSASGKLLSGFPVVLAKDAHGAQSPTVGDVNNDGALEVVVSTGNLQIFTVSAAGKVLGAALKPKAQVLAPVNLMDLDGDSKLELVFDSNTAPGGLGFVEAYNADGTPAKGFPLRPRGHTMANTPTLADVDNDGTLELGMITSVIGGTSTESWVNLWPMAQAKEAKLSWPTYAQNPRRSSCLGCAKASSTKWKADGIAKDGGPEAGPDAGSDAGANQGRPDTGQDSGDPQGGNDTGCDCGLARAPISLAPTLIWTLFLLTLLGRRRAFTLPRRPPRTATGPGRIAVASPPRATPQAPPESSRMRVQTPQKPWRSCPQAGSNPPARTSHHRPRAAPCRR